MSGSDDYLKLIQWLDATYPEGATIRWFMDNRVESGAVTGWIDVCIQGMEVLDLNWVWSIYGPDERNDDEVDPSDICLAHDKELHVVAPFEGYEPTGEEPVVVTEAHEAPTEEQVWELCANLGDREIITYPAWSVWAVNNALANWCLEHIRKGYIFVLDEDPELLSPLAQEAVRALEDYESGKVPGYDLGDGIIASEATMDYLLSLDPSESAELTAELKEAVRQLP